MFDGAADRPLRGFGKQGIHTELAQSQPVGTVIRKFPRRSAHEIFGGLRGARIISAARFERLLFQHVEERKRLRRSPELRKILRSHDRRIREETVAIGIAHAVCAELSAVGGRRNQFSSGTHAEGRRAGNRTVCIRFRCETVFRAAQRRRRFPHTVAELVDELLRMLDPATDLKSFQGRFDARIHEIQDKFPCAVPARGYHRRRFKRLAVRQNNAFADIALHEDRIGAGAPFELAAERNDLVADRRNQQRQFIRTDMRMAEITDFAGSSELDERIKNITDAPVADPRVKFAVGPCAGAALAEQEVALLDEFARGVEIINILMAAVHILAPFENDGPDPA